MTTEELLAIPEDMTDRMLIDGRLVEWPMTYRDRWGAACMAHLAAILCDWSDAQPEPRGVVLAGTPGFRLFRDPDTTIGIDAAFVSPDVMARQTDAMPLVEGVPVLAIEIPLPCDTHEKITLKLATYRRARVPLVRRVNAIDRTVTVYRLGAKPKLVDDSMDLNGEPELPGFSVMAAQLFEE